MRRLVWALVLVLMLSSASVALAGGTVTIAGVNDLKSYLNSLTMLNCTSQGDYDVFKPSRAFTDAFLVTCELGGDRTVRITPDELNRGYRTDSSDYAFIMVELDTDLVLKLKGGTFHADSVKLTYCPDMPHPTVEIVYSDRQYRYTYTVGTDEFSEGISYGTIDNTSMVISMDADGIYDVTLINNGAWDTSVSYNDFFQYERYINARMWTFDDGSRMLQEREYFMIY